LKAGEFFRSSTDLSVVLPENTYGRIAPRGYLAAKYGIDVLGGVIDRDFTGCIVVVLVNHGPSTVKIDVNVKIATLICERFVRCELEVEESPTIFSPSPDQHEHSTDRRRQIRELPSQGLQVTFPNERR